jgi:hypothetical protein
VEERKTRKEDSISMAFKLIACRDQIFIIKKKQKTLEEYRESNSIASGDDIAPVGEPSRDSSDVVASVDITGAEVAWLRLL